MFVIPLTLIIQTTQKVIDTLKMAKPSPKIVRKQIAEGYCDSWFL